jgi:hypothetical protein
MKPVKKRTAKLPPTDRPDEATGDDDAFAREMRDVVPLNPTRAGACEVPHQSLPQAKV